MDALSCQGTAENDIAYQVAIFDGQDHYCQLIAWGPSEEREELYSHMDGIISSFRDLSAEKPADPDPAYMGNPAGSGEQQSGS